MTAEIPELKTREQALEFLREEVPEHLVGKKPKLNCRDCGRKGGTGDCPKHKKAKCPECKQWISTAHVHLDFFGHAETTDRLLDADLEWNWEPMARTPDGLPAFDKNGGLWIKLTVAGVTRIGYGTADNGGGFKNEGDVIKEVIGDAIRNGSMRFGVALNLWAKTELHSAEGEHGQTAAPSVREPRVAKPRGAQRSKPSAPADDEWTQPAPDGPRPSVKGQRIAISQLFADKHGIGGHERDRKLAGVAHYLHHPVSSTTELTYDEAAELIDTLSKLPPYNPRPKEPAPSPEEQQAATARVQAEELAATAEPDADRIESDLRDRIESAGHPSELAPILADALAAAKSGRIGTVHLTALKQAAKLRERTLEAEVRQAQRTADEAAADQAYAGHGVAA